MQVVEYREQRAGCLRTGHFLQVVEQQTVHRLEIVDEFRYAALGIESHMLIHVLELTHGHEQNACLGIAFLDPDADGLDQMGLAHAHIAIKEIWIELRFFRIVGYMFRYGVCNLIGLPYAIVLERKLVVKLRVEIIALLLDRCGFSLPCDRTGQRVGPFGTQYLYARLVVVADDVVFQNESVVSERLTESEI